MSPFSVEELRGMVERAHAVEELCALGDSWIGPDVNIGCQTIIQPLEIVRMLPLVVSIESFPKISLTRGALGAFYWSVRSCLAQSGVEIRFHRAYVTDETIKDLQKGKTVAIPVDIINHVPRPIVLEGPVMRFFWFSGKTNMIREGLRKAVGNEIFLDGKEGEDWSFRDGEFSEDEKRMLKKIEPWLYKDVCLKLSIKQKFHTPKSSEPICVKSKKDLPGILREIGKEKSPDFCIGETVSVKLGSNVIGVVATYAGEKSERHILSPLIDPGFTGPIRTETLYGLDHIDLFLYKTCKPIVNC